MIPALHEADRIRASLASARAPGVEVVVVDGGSRDRTCALAREAGARVIVSPPGRARQMAAGAAATRAEVILFLHADTTLPAGWSAAVRAALADPAVVGGAFRLRFDDRSHAMRLVEWGARLRVALAGLPYGDQALFVRRRALEAIGGVPQTPLMEDVDLVRRLRRRGRLAVLEAAVVTSARRYREGGVLRTWLRHALALAADTAGVDRARIRRWVGR